MGLMLVDICSSCGRPTHEVIVRLNDDDAHQELLDHDSLFNKALMSGPVVQESYKDVR